MEDVAGPWEPLGKQCVAMLEEPVSKTIRKLCNIADSGVLECKSLKTLRKRSREPLVFPYPVMRIRDIRNTRNTRGTVFCDNVQCQATYPVN